MLIDRVLEGEDELLTVMELSHLLKKDRRWIWDAARGGTLPSVRVGREFRFSRAAIDDWLAGNSSGASDTSRD